MTSAVPVFPENGDIKPLYIKLCSELHYGRACRLHRGSQKYYTTKSLETTRLRMLPLLAAPRFLITTTPRHRSTTIQPTLPRAMMLISASLVTNCLLYHTTSLQSRLTMVW